MLKKIEREWKVGGRWIAIRIETERDKLRETSNWEGTGGTGGSCDVTVVSFLVSTSSIGTFRFHDYSIPIELLR